MPQEKTKDLPLEIERKLLIRMPSISLLEAQAGAFADHIIQTYLTSSKEETRRVRARTSAEGKTVYTETRKVHIASLTSTEEERAISREEYEALLREKDMASSPIEKIRHVIPYDGHLIEIDIYPFWQKIAVLEVELLSEDEEFSLPPYIHVIADVSCDSRFKNRTLAKKIPNENDILADH